MERANRYQWVSILKYDHEFCLLQATYNNYPWSFDSNHLHTVILEPIYKTFTYTQPSGCPLNCNPPLLLLLIKGKPFAVTLIVQGVAASKIKPTNMYEIAARLGEKPAVLIT